MTDIVLNDITSGYNIAKINANFQKIEDSINNDVLNLTGGNNTMGQDVDLNSHKLLNVEEIDAAVIKVNGRPVTESEFVLGIGVVGQENVQPAYDASLTKVVDLASTATGKGASLVGYQQQGTGSVASNIKAALLGFFYTPQMFGAVGDGVTDDTTAVQNWVTACQTYGYAGYVPATANGFRLTATINVTAGFSMRGDGCEPFIGSLVSTGANQRGRGSWFFLDHAGKGFTLKDISNAQRNGLMIERIGTYRNQPTPNGGAYTPGAFDYDFIVDTCDATFRDVMLLNPTQGIYHTGGYGRLTCENVRGQPLSIGTCIDGSADVNRLKGMHWWPFWTNDAGVRAYQKSNAIAFKYFRCDVPVMNDCFCIGFAFHTWIGQGATGSTGNLRMDNCYADLGGPLLYIDPAAVGAGVLMVNGVCFADKTSASGEHSNIWVRGSSCKIQISNSFLTNARINAVRNEGTNNFIELTNVQASAWNQGNTGAEGYHCDGGAIQIDTKIPNTLGANSGPIFGGTAVASITLGAPLAAGAGAITTDASGFATITHNANASPRRLFITTYSGAPYFVQPTGTMTNTTAQVRVWQAGGTTLASTAVNIMWRAEY